MHFFKVPKITNGSGNIVTGKPVMFSAELDHKALTNWVSKPKIVKHKDLEQLICFTRLSSLSRLVYPDGTPRRKTENVRQVDAFLIDYDGGNRFDNVHSSLKAANITHYMYTSFSHGDVSKGTCDRFRVLIPLQKPLSGDWWRHPSHTFIQRHMHKLFAFGEGLPDDVSFRAVHGHIGPIKHPDRDYRWAAFEGDLFNALPYFQRFVKIWSELEEKRLKEEEGRRKTYAASAPVVVDIWVGDTCYHQSSPEENFKKAVEQKTTQRLEALPWSSRGTGTVHSELLRIVANLRHCDFEWHEIDDILSPFKHMAHKGEIDQMLKSMM